MEHVDNDMDDLFSKAGDLYPLKTSESDWDGVLGKLRAETPGNQVSIPVIAVKGKNKKRRWGFLFLLIPIGLGSAIYFSSGKKIHNPVPRDSAMIQKGLTPDATNKKAETTGLAQKSNTPAADRKQSGESNMGRSAQTLHGETPENNHSSGKKGNAATDPFNNKGYSNNGNKTAERTGHIKTQNDASAGIDAVSVSPAGADSKSIPAAIVIMDPIGKSVSSSASGQKQISSVQESLISKATPKDSSANKMVNNKTDPLIKSSKGIYVGLLAGPDWSAVKFQDVKQTGFSFGVLVGYRFNKRIAIESGFMMDKKYYYSSGEYFNTSKTGLPYNEYVLNLTGNCFMFEIPVNIRYDFSTGKNHGFFANAGLSSYLMKKENYSVNLIGSQGLWPYPDTSYLNSTKNLFSVLQLSAGYERAIGAKTKIRVEPYIKIPLQGIGIGSLPISSAGIYFGIIHSFK